MLLEKSVKLILLFVYVTTTSAWANPGSKFGQNSKHEEIIIICTCVGIQIRQILQQEKVPAIAFVISLPSRVKFSARVISSAGLITPKRTNVNIHNLPNSV
jgi:hypothetical protein